MPVSKKGTLYFTAEECKAAKQNNNALEYVRRQGYDLVREGSYYRFKDHDSLVFTPEGKWFWNSRRLHGSALEFIVQYEGRSFPEAVLILAGDTALSSDYRSCPEPSPLGDRSPAPPPTSQKASAAPVEFKLPPPAGDMRRLFGYLCGARKLDYGLVKEMVAQGGVYESLYGKNPGKELHNACFVSYNNMGVPVSAFQRGITTGSTFKGDVPGSSKEWGWLLSGKRPAKLYIFEAAIDAASYVTLRLRHGEYPLDDGDYLALGGLIFDPIRHYLDAHPHVEEITLLLDGDVWGKAAANRFQDELRELGCRACNRFPPFGKDWNDTLLAVSSNK